ncbi:hypothetical protein GF362_04370 [Candidatus Dojkabacteria bacterium]|nr:hypothetical protein [Candidatus Dojkabacteria bacterium]
MKKKLKVIFLIFLVFFLLALSLGISSLLREQQDQSPEKSEASATNTVVVCPASDPNNDCDFDGADYPNDNGKAIQLAIDSAENGSIVLIKQGEYRRSNFEVSSYINDDDPNTRYEKTFLHIKQKQLNIKAEDDTILSGNTSNPMSAIIIKQNSNIEISNLKIIGFKKDADNPEECRYNQENPCSWGDGIYVSGESIVDLYNMELSENNRGIVITQESTTKMYNNQITKNRARGATIGTDSSGSIINNIFYRNGHQGFDCSKNARCVVKNNISLNNKEVGIIAKGEENFVELKYNLSYGNESGDWNDFLTKDDLTAWGNKSLDPQFINETDFHLKLNSPAIDAGDPDSKYNDLDGTRNDMGIYGGQFGRCPRGQCKLESKCYEQGTVFSEGRICWEEEIKQPRDEAGCTQVEGCWDSSVDRCFFSGTTRSDDKICQNSVWIDGTVTPTITQTSTPQAGDLQKPTVYSYLTTTYEETQKVSGSKQEETGIIVDDELVVDINGASSWSHVFSLDNLGLNTFLIKSRNQDLEESSPLTLEIKRCVLADMNCEDQRVDISDLSLFIKSIKSNCKGGLHLGDLNQDGSCDVSDFELFKEEYLKYN